MDERVSNIVTIEDRWYLSCDSVSLGIKPLEGTFVDNRHEMKERLQLWREWAPIEDDPDEPIRWREATDCGQPDMVVTISGWRDRLREFQWLQSWPEDFWCVKYMYMRTDKRFRVRIRLEDTEGQEHIYYVVPWAP